MPQVGPWLHLRTHLLQRVKKILGCDKFTEESKRVISSWEAMFATMTWEFSLNQRMRSCHLAKSWGHNNIKARDWEGLSTFKKVCVWAW